MKNQKVIDLLRWMPRLDHWPARPAPFDIWDSELGIWLIRQPEVIAWLCEEAMHSGAIYFNPEKKSWEGVGDGPLLEKRRRRSNRQYDECQDDY